MKTRTYIRTQKPELQNEAVSIKVYEDSEHHSRKHADDDRPVPVDVNTIDRPSSCQPRTFHAPLSDLEQAEQATEEGQAKLGNDETQVAEEDDNSSLEARKENTSNLDNSDDNRAEELTIRRSISDSAERFYDI